MCDGVGGSEMGDTAAALAVATFIGEIARVYDRLPLKLRVMGLIRRADDVVRAECRGRGATTLSVVAASGTGELVAANVGDSRIFSWSARTGQLEQVSVDDTLENEMLDLKVADASVLDARGLRGSLTQAIGEPGRRSEELEVRTYGRERLTGAILATDGTWKGQESGFTAIAVHARSANEVVSRLVNFALWAGGADNISVIAIDNLDALAVPDTAEASRTAEPRVSLWTGSKRVTICSVLRFGTAISDAGIPAAPSKKKSRRKKRTASKAEAGESQMDSIDSDRFPSVKPRIEISTDDNPT